MANIKAKAKEDLSGWSESEYAYTVVFDTVFVFLFSLCTSKVGAVSQLHLFVELGDNTGHTVLDEVHLLADGTLPDDIISGLEDLEAELGQHGCHKVWVSIGKQGHGCHQLTAVEVDNFLRENIINVTEFELLSLRLTYTTYTQSCGHPFK